MNRPATMNALCLATIVLVTGLPAQANTAVTGRSLTSQSGVTTRRVWGGDDADSYGAPSPDGRLLTYIDWAKTGDLAIRDLVTGQNRNLTNAATKGSAWYSAFAPDGRQIVYGWYSDSTHLYELRLIDPDGANQRVLLTGNNTYLGRPSWSPHGDEIAIAVQPGDAKPVIELVSVKTGARRTLKTFSGRWLFAETIVWSPDGRFLAYDLPESDGSHRNKIHILAADGAEESLATSDQASDAVVGWSPAGDRLLFFSDREGTEGVWSVPVTGGKVTGKATLVRRDLWQSTPIGVSRAGLFYAVTVETPSLFVATVDLRRGRVVVDPAPYRSKATGTISAGDNGQPVWADWSPDGRRLAFSNTDRRGTSISIWTLESDEVRRIPLQLDYPPATLSWAPDGKSLFAFGSHLLSEAGIFRIDLSSGRTTLVVSGGEGAGGQATRPWLAKDGRTLYYIRGVFATGHRALLAHDLVTGVERTVSCCSTVDFALSPDGRSLALLTDGTRPEGGMRSPRRLEVLPVGGGAGRILYQAPSPTEALLRSGGVTWSKDGRQLLFVRVGGDVMVMPAAGGEPRKILGPRVGFGLRLHPDGRRIAYTSGTKKTEIWVMENLAPAKAGSTRK